MPGRERPESARDIQASVMRHVRRRLGRSVKNLRVCVQDDILIVSGQAPSYYAKQLVQQIVMDVTALSLCNEIQVS